MPTLVPRDLDARFVNALQAEFLGTALLQFLAALSGTSWGYGFSYAALGACQSPCPVIRNFRNRVPPVGSLARAIATRADAERVR